MNYRKIKYKSGVPALLALGMCLVGSALAGNVQETRAELREWIQVQQLMSNEQASWAGEEQILQDRIALLKAEKAQLEAAIAEASENVGEVQSKRAEVNAQREELRSLVADLQQPLAELEQRAKDVYAQFPQPLKEETSRLAQRIPGDPTATSLSVSERLQAVVGLLNFADKFNTGVQREVEIRELEGRQVEVETLYFGLAAAYYADASGTIAGIGQPGADGWQWQSRPEQAGDISRLIEIYRGTREAAFQNVPVEIAQ